MNRKLVGMLLVFVMFGTVSICAQSKRSKFQPNGTIISRQKNNGTINRTQQKLAINVSADGGSASFSFDNGKDRIDIAPDSFGRIGFQYYNDGRLQGSGVFTEESLGGTKWSWKFEFVNVNTSAYKKGDILQWEVQY